MAEDRTKPLDDHLQKIGARFYNEWDGQKHAPSGKRSLWQLWGTAKRMYLVEFLPDGDGWQVWSPVVDSNRVDDTLAAIT